MIKIKNGHIKPAWARVHFVHPGIGIIDGQGISESLRGSLGGVVGHMVQHPQHGASMHRPRALRVNVR